MRKLAPKAELRALRAQVNPISCSMPLPQITSYLIQTAPDRAVGASGLSGLLRGVLKAGEIRHDGEDLDLIEAYSYRTSPFQKTGCACDILHGTAWRSLPRL